jgi:hypothetical protein
LRLPLASFFIGIALHIADGVAAVLGIDTRRLMLSTDTLENLLLYLSASADASP